MGLDDTLGDIAGDILGLGGVVSEAVEDIIGEILSILDGPIEVVKNTVKDIAADIIGIPGMLVDTVQDGVNAVKGGFDFMAEKIGEGVSAAGDLFDGLKNTATGAIMSVWDFFEETGTKIAQTLIGAFAGISHFITDQLAKMSRAMTFAFNEVRAGIENAFEFVVDGWREWTKLITDSIEWLVNQLGEVLEVLFGELVGVFTKAFDLSEDALTDMFTTVMKVQKRVSEDMLRELLPGGAGGAP